MGTSGNIAKQKTKSEPKPSPEQIRPIQIPKISNQVFMKTQSLLNKPLFQEPPQQQYAFFQSGWLIPQEQNNPQITHCPGNCGNGFIFEGDNYEFFCGNCEQTYCLKCRTLFHFNKTCAQVKQEQAIKKREDDQQLDNQFETGQHLVYQRNWSLLQSAYEDAYKQLQIIHNPVQHLAPLQDLVESAENSVSASDQDSSQGKQEYWHSQFVNMILTTYEDQQVDIKEQFADCFILALQLGRFQSQRNELDWVPHLNTILYSIQVLGLQYFAKLHLISEFMTDFRKDFDDLIETYQIYHQQITVSNYPIGQLFTTIQSQQNNSSNQQNSKLVYLLNVFALGVECGRNAQIHTQSGKHVISALLDLAQELTYPAQKIKHIMNQLLNELIQTRTSQLHLLLNRQCPICLEKIDYTNLIKIASCQHSFHKKCLGDHVDSSLQISPNQIKCPEICTHFVTMKEIQQIFEKDKQETIQEIMNKRLFQENPALYSTCPTANCDYAFIFEGNDNFQFLCPTCLQSYCFQCRVQYHFNQTCAQFKETREFQSRIRLQQKQDQQFQEFVRGQNFKQCPKCTIWVERISGCLHMTCLCKYEFCYRCGGKYKQCSCGG